MNMFGSWIRLIAIAVSFGVGSSLSMRANNISRRKLLSNIACAAPIAVSVNPIKTEAAVAGQDAVYIPGVAGGAILKNLIVDEEKTKWNPPDFVTNLAKSRIPAKELSPLNPSLIPFASDNELYYDKFMFGAWTAKATLRRKVFPYGKNYLPSLSLFEGSPRNREEVPGDSTTYEMHYFASNMENGDISDKSKIIAERAFNAMSLSTAYKQLSQVDEVIWDYKKDPTRLTVKFSSLAEDFQPLGEKKAEIYLTSRKSESGQDSVTGEKIFAASERLRSVVLVPGNVVVSDTETITEFRRINDNQMKAVSRIAVYLTPNPNSREGILWQDVNGKAVAFYDYEIDLTRLTQTTEDGEIRACVYTPNGAIQCST